MDVRIGSGRDVKSTVSNVRYYYIGPPKLPVCNGPIPAAQWCVLRWLFLALRTQDVDLRYKIPMRCKFQQVVHVVTLSFMQTSRR